VKLSHIVVGALLLLTAQPAGAADLESVRASLTPLRAQPSEALPAGFFTARDRLRDWVEAHLQSFPRTDDTAALTATLNAAVAAADLACADTKPPGYDRCTSPSARDELDARGYLGRVDVGTVRDLLIVKTELGVACGFDQTVYVYEWANGRWRRMMDTAQRPDAAGGYLAEQIQQVMFGQPANMPPENLLLVTTGVQPVCGSSFRPAHYRVWAVKRAGASAQMIDGRESNAYVGGAREPAVSARFAGEGLLVEMDIASIDPARRTRTAVRRFDFDAAGAHRIAPIALTPRDFVEEWLAAPWSAASAWTAPATRTALENIHREINAGGGRASFIGATQRCAKDADTAQVTVRFANGEKSFRMKHDPAGAYEMRAVDSAAAICSTPDSSLDTPRSLF